MRDEAGLLQAIREQPDDAMARLAYADWLEERGDPRADLVRNIEAIPENERVAMRLRYAEAIRKDTYNDGLLAAFDCWFRNNDPEIAAFRERLKKLLNPALEMVERIDSSREVRELFMENREAWGELYPGLGNNSIGHGSIWFSEQNNMADPHHTSLLALFGGSIETHIYADRRYAPEELGANLALVRRLHKGVFINTDQFISALSKNQSHLERLESLSITEDRISETAAAMLAEISLPNLRNLNLRKSSMGDKGVTTIANAAYLSGLESVNLALNRLTNAEPLILFLRNSPKLKRLEFDPVDHSVSHINLDSVIEEVLRRGIEFYGQMEDRVRGGRRSR